MKAADIDRAAVAAGADPGRLCIAFQTVLPVLEVLAQRQNFVVRLFLGGFMGAIESYVEQRCG